MDYYKLSNFEREPFSNTPDPGLFYNSKQHLETLQQIEISVRLKRGLNVIIGDIGTGKTTLSRQLIQKISNDTAIKYYLVLDPGFTSTNLFLRYLLDLFQPGDPHDEDDENRLKEKIKNHLFTDGVDNKMNTIIIIDEGQKLSLGCIEILRELLNFETNDHKLLQIVIFAQKEFQQSLDQVKNFKDRINFYHRLNPLNFTESKGLIRYRLEKCLARGESASFFNFIGYFLIYRATRGFPRKIVNLCHQIILSLITKNKSKADFFLIQSCINKVFPERKNRSAAALLLFILIVIPAGAFYTQFIHKDYFNSNFLTSLFQKTEPVPKIEPAPLQNSAVKNLTSSMVQNIQVEPVSDKIEPPDIPVQIAKIYGSIQIPKKSTLSIMSKIVYGSYGETYLAEIVKVNPDIQNPKKIRAGTSIFFPVIQGSGHTNPDDYFIVLSEPNTISGAFQTAFGYRLLNMKVRIFPTLKQDGSFFFPVIINKSFNSIHAADQYKKRLPGNIIAESKQIPFIGNSIKHSKG